MSEKENWGWVALYEAVLFETEPQRFPERIARARTAMSKRLREIRRSSDQQEREYLAYAVNNLQVVEAMNRTVGTT